MKSWLIKSQDSNSVNLEPVNVASSPGVNVPANKVIGEKLASTEGASLVNLKIGSELIEKHENVIYAALEGASLVNLEIGCELVKKSENVNYIDYKFTTSMVNHWSIENKLYPNVLPSEVVHVSQSTVKNHFIVIDMNCELIMESVNRDIPVLTRV